MSSDMKDARWQLAGEVCELLKIEWDGLAYERQQEILDSCQNVLHLTSTARIAELAAKWKQES